MVKAGRGFALDAGPAGQVQGELWGALAPAQLAELEAALVAAEAGPGPRRLLLRTEEVTACEPAAEARWVLLQRRLARGSWRTAYLDARPWGRGLALRVAHRAEDAHARPVGSEAQAQAWLAGTQGRLDEALALLDGGAR
jgi:hypothetical protein